MEYQITLAVDRCTALTFRFFAASWWNSFTSCWVPFRGFPLLSCPFIYTLTLSIIVRRCLKSPSPIAAYRWKLIFFVARQVIESLLHEIFSAKKLILARNPFHKQRIYHQKSINTQQSFRLGRTSLYREGLIIPVNIYRNLHKAVYKKEDFKRLDRRRSFSINSLNFYQAILQSSPQTRFMFDIKKLYIITRCAKIYSRRNSTGRGELRSINPNSVEGDFHNPLTSSCETLYWQKPLVIL